MAQVVFEFPPTVFGQRILKVSATSLLVRSGSRSRAAS